MRDESVAGVREGYTGRVLVGLDRLALALASASGGSAGDLAPAALDRLLAELRSRRVGLLCHPASVDRQLVHARHVLQRLGARITMVFGPEHGYGGEAQDLVGVPHARDPSGVPIRSLYGSRFEELSPAAEDLAEIDLLLVDLQDVGARYYTFVWTAVLATRACARAGVPVVVLDRPNPIGASPAHVEGRRQADAYRSFVGLEPIPVRHGLTLGEIVAWRAEVEGVAPELVRIVPALGLPAPADASAWDRPFVMPSPNMPTLETALVYPGACLVEGTNLSEGRGTTRPFELFGAPWLDGARLADDYASLRLPGSHARAVTFRPTFQKHAGQICGGVQVHVLDRATFRPFASYVALLTLVHRQAPERFVFRTEPYEFRDDVPAFDLLTGSAEARERILRGESPRDVAEAMSTVDEADRAIVVDAREAGRRRRVT